jgi:hypothetical protein
LLLHARRQSRGTQMYARRVDARAVRPLLLGLVMVVLAVQSGEAQRVDRAPDQIRHIQSVEPISGPPGTLVRVHTENLPIQARIHVGVGARHVGFEALAEVQQGEWGDVTAELQIPDYWTWDRPLVLIIFNGLFSPIGLSDPFHVTNASGMIQRSGRITDEGGDCVGFRDQDDYFYSLEGALGELKPGDDIVVEGALSESGRCGSDNTIRVERFARGGLDVPGR